MTSQSKENVGKRGPTTLKKLKRKKGTDEKYELEWNSKGQAIGKNRTIFMSYIGVCARTLVDINIARWDHVPKETKESVWTSITDMFEVPANKHDWVIAIACDRWRSFKTKLNRFMYDKDGNICTEPPSLYPFISQETWDEFVSTRQTNEFKEQSNKHREISKKNLYPYRGSRKGYVGIEEEIIRANTENNSSESPLDALASAPTVPRNLLWKKARIGKNGNMDEPVKQVVAKMDSLSQQVAAGEISLHGRQDILATALGTKEHAGRVRGAGIGVTITEYFGRDVPLRSSSQIVERLNTMEEQITALKRMVTELQSTKSPQSAPGLQSTQDVQPTQNLQSIQDLTEPWDAVGSIARSYLDFPEGWTECELASSMPGNPVVATGKVFNTCGTEPVMLHDKQLEPGYMKVTIIDPKVQDAPLPMPTDEAYTVFEAVGAFVAWPKDLIFRSTMELQLPSGDKDEGLSKQNACTVSKTLAPAPKSQSAPLKLVFKRRAVQVNDDNISTKKDKSRSKQIERTQPKAPATTPTTELRPLQSNQATANQQQKLTTLTMKLMYRCVRGMTCDDTITIDMSPIVWKEEHKILISKEQLLQWLFQESVQASHVSVYIKYLFNLCQERGISDMFVFLRPQLLSPDANHAVDEEVGYIGNAMKGANRNQIYFATYNDGSHWMLCAIHPLKDQAYWLDPAGNEAHPDIKKIVQAAIRKFYAQKRRKKPKSKTLWFEIKCPQQPNNDDSGYCVLRYMQEIIEKRQDVIPEQYYEDSPAPGAYEQHHIDEVRDKWIEFVQNHMD